MNLSTRGLRDAAVLLLDAMGADGRTAARQPFATPDRTTWTYLPGSRPGVAVGDLTPTARVRLDELLAVTLSAAGAWRTRQIMALDDVLEELERAAGRPGWSRRGSELYWVRVLGDPTDEVWAWHIGGHHVAVHATVVGDELALTPCFFGAQPAVLRSGPRAGLQVLREEEGLARELLAALDADRRRVALFSDRAPADIATRHDPVADPSVVSSGIRRGDLESAQAVRFDALIRCYLERAPSSVADQAWRAAAEAGLDEITFGWAGSTAPGGPHYYAVKGPTLLLEYDNTQDGANHVHTVWRDLQRDWGADLLAEHHARAHSYPKR